MKPDRIAYLAHYGAVARYTDIQKRIMNEGTTDVLLDMAQKALQEVIDTKAYYIEIIEKGKDNEKAKANNKTCN